MKNKKVLLTLIILFTNLKLLAQWNLIGGPYGTHSFDILLTSDRKLFSATYKGLYFSEDLGDTWELIQLNNYYGAIYKLKLLRNNTFLAVSDNGIIKSSDGGKNWKLIFQLAGDESVKIQEVKTNGFLYLKKARQLLKSTNNGENWEIIFNSSTTFDDFAVDSSGNLYLSIRSNDNYYNYLLRSTDGGINFRPFALTGYDLSNKFFTITSDECSNLFFKVRVNDFFSEIIHYDGKISKRVFYGGNICGFDSYGNLLFSTNNHIYRYYPNSKFSDLIITYNFSSEQPNKIVNIDNIYILKFETSGLFRYHFSKREWVDINKGHGFKQALSIEITEKGKIFVGAFSNTFWGGLYGANLDSLNWSRIEPLRCTTLIADINKLKNGNLIATGTGDVMIGDPEGNNWIFRPVIGLAYSQFVSSNGTIYIGEGTGEFGIYISRDNGNSFNPHNNGIMHDYIFGFGEGKNGRIFAFPWPSGLYMSDNEGISWQYIAYDNISDVRFYNLVNHQDTLFAATSSGLLFSTDNGINWKLFQNTYQSISYVIVTKNSDIIIAVYNKSVLKYDRKNNIWNSLDVGLSDKYVREIIEDIDGRIYIATNEGIYCTDILSKKPLLLFPKNLTKNLSNRVNLIWEKTDKEDENVVEISQDSLFNKKIISITLKNNHYEFLADYNKKYYWRVGKKYKYRRPVFSEVFSFETENRLYLKQNYPNPFNEATAIEFNLPEKSIVNINIYNSLGEKIQSIYDNVELIEGYHKLEWKPVNIPSGIYFINLEYKNLRQTIKCLYIK